MRIMTGSSCWGATVAVEDGKTGALKIELYTSDLENAGVAKVSDITSIEFQLLPPVLLILAAVGLMAIVFPILALGGLLSLLL